MLACVSFSHRAEVPATTRAEATFQIVETPSNAQTISQEGKTRLSSVYESRSANDTAYANHPIRLCGNFSFTSAGQKTLRLMYEQDVLGVITGNRIIGDAASGSGQQDIHWEVYPINYQSGALPIFKGMVTSNSSGRVRSEAASFAAAANEATICSGSPCTIHAQTGSWLTGVTRSGAGVYVGAIASGIFSQTPMCTCTALSTSSQGGLCHVIRSSSSSTSLDIRTFQNNLTPADTAVQVQCMGSN